MKRKKTQQILALVLAGLMILSMLPMAFIAFLGN